MDKQRPAPVVVGVDGSETALRAVSWASREARRRGAPLRIVHAAPYADGDATCERQAGLILTVAHTVAGRAAPGLPVVTERLSGPMPRSLADAGAGAQLLVVGMTGEPARRRAAACRRAEGLRARALPGGRRPLPARSRARRRRAGRARPGGPRRGRPRGDRRLRRRTAPREPPGRPARRGCHEELPPEVPPQWRHVRARPPRGAGAMAVAPSVRAGRPEADVRRGGRLSVGGLGEGASLVLGTRARRPPDGWSSARRVDGPARLGLPRSPGPSRHRSGRVGGPPAAPAPGPEQSGGDRSDHDASTPHSVRGSRPASDQCM